MRISRLAAPVTLLGVLACGDAPSSTSDLDGTHRIGAQEINAQASTSMLRGTDSLFAAIADSIPGFAGMYADEDSMTVILLTDPDRMSRARAVVATMSGRAGYHVREAFGMRAKAAKFDAHALLDWKAKVRTLFSDPTGVSVDFDEVRNRVSVKVTNEAAVSEWHAKILQLGVPADAFAVSVSPLPVVSSDLTDRIRPMHGSLRFEYVQDGDYARCTIGFIAHRSGVLGMVSASHCSDRRGLIDSPYLQQDDYGWGMFNVVAQETVDPPNLTSYPGCPSGKVCRYSDAAFSQIVNNQQVAKKIARTAVPNSTSISAVYNVVGTYNPIAGNGIYKTGITTGTTYGTVADTCVDTAVFGNNVYLFCQGLVTAASDEGDSGGPVFATTSGVLLAGILWGSTPTQYYYSSISQIQADLGTLSYVF